MRESPQSAKKKGQADIGDERRLQIVKAAARLFSENGYFQTKIDDIANEAKVSKGLIYLYFKDKQEVLFNSMRFILDIYERDMAILLESSDDPLEILRLALRQYCRLVDAHRLESILAYRSTKDLNPPERQQIKIHESKSSRVFRNCIEACVHKGIMKQVNIDIMTYQYIMFCHAWALKNWAFRDKYNLEDYIKDGEALLIDNFLTEYGKSIGTDPSA